MTTTGRVRETLRLIKAWTGETTAQMGRGCGWSRPTMDRKLSGVQRGGGLGLDDLDRICAHYQLTPSELLMGFGWLEQNGRLPQHIRQAIQTGQEITPGVWRVGV
jgi:hypothetical protein